MNEFSRPFGYDQIIKENFNIEDLETRKTLLNIDETDQNNVLGALTSRLYDNIIDKADDIDYGTIPSTKGDVTKLENYDKLVDCINIMRDILKQYKQDTAPVDEIDQALGNLRSRKDIFEKGFRYDLEFIMVTYSTIYLAIISSVSYLISSTIEFIKAPNQDDFTISLNSVALVKTKQSLLYNDLKKWNTSCSKGDVDRAFQYILSHQVKNLVGDVPVVLGGIALVGIILTILPLLRELIFFFYYSRMRISDYFDVQADLLQVNAYNVQNDDLMKKDEKSRISKKQLKIVSIFRNIADKVSFDHKKSEVSASKDLSKKQDKYKTSDLLDSAPDSVAAANSDGSLF